jgi:hypothetical protein
MKILIEEMIIGKYFFPQFSGATIMLEWSAGDMA